MSELAISHSAEDCRGSRTGLLAFPPVYSEELCAGFAGTRQGCTACLSVCPHEALAHHGESIVIDSDLCQRCGGCVAACPTGALTRRFAPDAEIFAVFAEALTRSPTPFSLLRIRCHHGTSTAMQFSNSCSDGLVEVEAPSLHMMAEGHLIGALAMGFRGVLLVPCHRCRQERGLNSPQRIVDLANRLLSSWGVKGLRCYLENDPGEDSSAWEATLLPIGNEPWHPPATSFHIRDVIAELAAHFEKCSDDFPAVGACSTDSYGQVTVSETLCTLCGACARVCPSGALQIATGDGLSFRQVDCVACGLCVSPCGENAITMETRLPAGPASRERRTLRQSEWVTCPDCGEITQSLAYIERIESLLGASPFYASAEQKRLLRMCERCKSGQRFGEMSPRGEAARATQTLGLHRDQLDVFPSAIDREPCGSFCNCKLEVQETPRTSPVIACSCAPDVPHPSPVTETPEVHNFDIFSLPVNDSAAQAHFDDTHGNGDSKLESRVGSAATKIDRRGILGLLGRLFAAAVAGAAVLKPGKILAAVTPANSTRKHRYGMVIDMGRCIGCKACTIACKQENKTPPGVSYAMVIDEPLPGSGNRPVPFTKPCFHCENPPCVPVCPVNATFKREQDGIVVVDYDRCIGCRYCITACPYGARFFDFGERYREEPNFAEDVPSPEYRQYRYREHDQSPIGNVRKCQFCMHLQDENGEYNEKEGRWPACAKTCTAKSIHFGDFMDPNSDVSRLLRERNAITLKPELGTQPNVYYLP